METEGHPEVYVEGGFFEGVRHLRLAIPVERTLEAGIPGDMDTVG